MKVKTTPFQHITCLFSATLIIIFVKVFSCVIIYSLQTSSVHHHFICKICSTVKDLFCIFELYKKIPTTLHWLKFGSSSRKLLFLSFSSFLNQKKILQGLFSPFLLPNSMTSVPLCTILSSSSFFLFGVIYWISWNPSLRNSYSFSSQCILCQCLDLRISTFTAHYNGLEQFLKILMLGFHSKKIMI